MPVRQASATWHGSLSKGHGHMQFADYEGSYSVPSRFEEGEGTNPEELSWSSPCRVLLNGAVLRTKRRRPRPRLHSDHSPGSHRQIGDRMDGNANPSRYQREGGRN